MISSGKGVGVEVPSSGIEGSKEGSGEYSGADVKDGKGVQVIDGVSVG